MSEYVAEALQKLRKERDETKERIAVASINAQDSLIQANLTRDAVRDWNPQKEVAARRYSKETGAPLAVARDMDNRDLDSADFSILAPSTVAFYGDASLATLAKGDENRMDDLFRTIDQINTPNAEQVAKIADQIRKNGYTDSQIADLKKLGIDPEAAGGPVVLPKWHLGKNEANFINSTERFVNDKSKWNLDSMMRYLPQLQREIALMEDLNSAYGDSWHDFSDEQLLAALKEIGEKLGHAPEEYNPDRFRASKAWEQQNFLRAANFFGTHDIGDWLHKPSDEDISKLLESASDYPLDAALAKMTGDNSHLREKYNLYVAAHTIKMFEDRSLELRGRTFGGEVLKGLIESAPVVAEMAATRGFAAPLRLVKEGGVKAIPKALAAFGKSMIQRSPLYAPAVAAQSADKEGIEPGDFVEGLSEKQLTDFATSFVNGMWNKEIELFSEGSMTIVGGPLTGAVLKHVPKPLLNNAMARALKSVYGTKAAETVRRWGERTGVSSIPEEYLEEKFGDIARALSTNLAEALGTEIGDLNQRSVFGTPDEELTLLATVASFGFLLKSPAAVAGAVRDAKGAFSRMDRVSALTRRRNKTVLNQNDPETATEVINAALSESEQTVELKPETILMLFQDATNPEGAGDAAQPLKDGLQKLGVTESALEVAQENGLSVPVSLAALTSLSEAEQTAVLEVAYVQDGDVTAKDAVSVDIETRANEQRAKAQAEATKFRKALGDLSLRMIKSGRSISEVLAVSKLFVVGNYLKSHVKGGEFDPAQWLNQLDFQRMDPEDFERRFGHTGKAGLLDVNSLFDSMITLVQGAADATTLTHEVGHYIYETMRRYVTSGLADETMTQDLKNLTDWAIEVTADPDAARGEIADAAKEKIADALVEFVRSGEAPDVKLASAFATLSNLMEPVVEMSEAAGGVNPAVLMVFRNMFAASRVVEERSPSRLMGKVVASVIGAMNSKAAKHLRHMAEKAGLSEQTKAMQAILKDANASMHGWTKEARDTVYGQSVYALWKLAKKTPVNYYEVKSRYGEEAANSLLEKGLAVRTGTFQSADLERLASVSGYTDIGQMLTDVTKLDLVRRDRLYRNANKKAFDARRFLKKRKANYGDVLILAGKETADALLKQNLAKHPVPKLETLALKAGYENASLAAAELAVAQDPELLVQQRVEADRSQYIAEQAESRRVSATEQTLDLIGALADKLIPDGEWRERKQVAEATLKRQSLRTVAKMRMGDALKSQVRVGDMRAMLDKMSASAKKGNITDTLSGYSELWLKAMNQKNLESVRDAEQKTTRILKRAIRAKRGVIDSRYQDALKDIAIRFGFTEAKATERTEGAASRAVADLRRFCDAMGAKVNIPEFLTDETKSFKDLTVSEFMVLGDFIQLLDRKGRNILSDASNQRRHEVLKHRSDLLVYMKLQDPNTKELIEQPEKEIKLPDWLNIVMKSYKALDDLCWSLDGRKDDGPFQRIISAPLRLAAGKQSSLAAKGNAIYEKAMKKVTRLSKKWDLTKLSGVTLKGDAAISATWGGEQGPNGWTRERVLVACLNMGTERNRNHLAEMLTGGEEAVNTIASVLDKESWEAVQLLWDAIDDPDLWQEASRVSREVFGYEPIPEQAKAFNVTLENGETLHVKGGYVPLRYVGDIVHSNTLSVENMYGDLHDEGLNLLGNMISRKDVKGKALDLRLGGIVGHMNRMAFWTSHAEALLEIVPLFRDESFKDAIEYRYGKLTYKALRGHIENIRKSGAEAKKASDAIGSYLTGVYRSLALFMDVFSAAMIFTTATVDFHKLNKRILTKSYLSYLSDPLAARRAVNEKSAYMASLSKGMDIDYQRAEKAFNASISTKVWTRLRDDGFVLFNWFSHVVNTPVWVAAYSQKIESGATESEAVAYADDFIASTQGGTRPIDLSAGELLPTVRGLTVFYSGVRALANKMDRTAVRLVHGEASAAEVVCNLLLPVLAPAALMYLRSGGGEGEDEEDDPRLKAAMKSILMTVPDRFPVVRDAADFALTRALGLGDRRSNYSTAGGRAINVMQDTSLAVIKAIGNEDYDYAAYKMAEVLGAALQVPTVTMYRDIQKQMESIGVELPDFDELKDSKREKTRW